VNKDLIELIKHEPNFVRLKNNISRTSHAHLVVCPDLLFSSLFCKELIKEILTNNNLSNLAQKIDSGAYVDIQEINGVELNSIKVLDIEPIIEKSNETGIESDFKFYIISGAEKLTPEAQNKLLKTLEEPNKSQFYFLCTSSRFLLLPTIVSRCNVIEIGEINKKEIESILLANGVERIKAQDDAELSLGSYTKATESQTNSDAFCVALNALTQITSSAVAATWATALAKSNLPQVTTYLEYLLLDAIKLKYDETNIWFENYREKLIKLKTCSLSGILMIYNQIQKIKELLKVNVSQVVIADKIALSIAEGKNKK